MGDGSALVSGSAKRLGPWGSAERLVSKGEVYLYGRGRCLVLKGIQVLNQHVRMRAHCRLLASALSGANVLGQFTESGSNIAQNLMVF